jgi:hypothetical protein
MFIEVPKVGYHFSEKDLEKISEQYGAQYIGYFQKPASDGRGGYMETPIDVWYQPKPDIAAGHSHYFGMYVQSGKVWITDASTCFDEPITGMLCDDEDEVIISRYRHDYVCKKGAMIDGGRVYTRSSLGTSVTCTMTDGQWNLAVWLERGAKPAVELSQVEKEFLDPENRAWEYDAAGVRVLKGTRTPFTGDMA